MQALNSWRRGEVAWWVAISVTILAGVWIRVGMDRSGIWGDEFAWFARFRESRSSDDLLSIRAPGYVLLHKVLFQNVYSTFTESRIRIVSIASGVLFVPVFALVVHRLFRSHWVTLIGALLASFNIALVSFTHEFKPYMLDLFLQTAWFYAAILVEDKRHAAIGGASVLIVACLFSYSAVPLLAFQMVYLLYHRAKGMIGGISFWVSLLIVLCTLAAAVLAYTTRFYDSNPPGYWGVKYGVFYSDPFEPLRFGRWLLAKVSTYLTYPLNVFVEPTPERGQRFRTGFGFVQHVGLGAVFCALAVAYWLKHRWDDPRLIPLYLLGGYTVAGVLHIWPLGFFRTNVFLFLYAALIVLGTLNSVGGAVRTAAVIMVLAPFAIFTLSNPIGEKINHIRTPQFLIAVCNADAREAIPIAADVNAAVSAFFHLEYDAAVRKYCGRRATLRRFKNLKTLSRLIASAPDHESGTWVLVQGGSAMHRNRIRDWLHERYDVPVEQVSRRMYLLNVRAKPAAKG